MTKTKEVKRISPSYSDKEYENTIMQDIVTGKKFSSDTVAAMLAHATWVEKSGNREIGRIRARAEARIDNINADEYKKSKRGKQ